MTSSAQKSPDFEIYASERVLIGSKLSENRAYLRFKRLIPVPQSVRFYRPRPEGHQLRMLKLDVGSLRPRVAILAVKCTCEGYVLYRAPIIMIYHILLYIYRVLSYNSIIRQCHYYYITTQECEGPQQNLDNNQVCINNKSCILYSPFSFQIIGSKFIMIMW